MEDCLNAGCVGLEVAALALEARVKPATAMLEVYRWKQPPQGRVELQYSSRKLVGAGVAASIEEALHEQ